MAETQSATSSESVGNLVGELTSEVSRLVRSEVDLAVTEMKQEMRQAAKAGGMLGGGALSGYFALLFGSLALAWLLDRKLPRWLAFGFVAAIYGAAAGALLSRGRQEAQAVDPVPRQTVETLKDSVDVIRPST